MKTLVLVICLFGFIGQITDDRGNNAQVWQQSDSSYQVNTSGQSFQVQSVDGRNWNINS